MPFPAILILLLGAGAYLASRPTKPNAAAGPPPPPPPPPPPVAPNYPIPSGALPIPPGLSPSGMPTVTVQPPQDMSPSAGMPYPLPNPMAAPAQTQAAPNPWAQATQAATDILHQISVALPPAQQIPPPSPQASQQPKPTPSTSPGAAATPGDSPADVLGKLGQIINNAAQAGGVTPTPLQHMEQSAVHDPNGSVTLAVVLISAEGLQGWKSVSTEDVKQWQRTVGLKVDGKFGPASALRMAQDVGVLPVIRYWPGGTTAANLPAKLNAYKNSLNGIAGTIQATNPAHAAALHSSSDYEQGQGLAAHPGPLNNAARVAQAAQLQSTLAGGVSS